MNDYYLKTTDSETLWNLLFAVGLAETITDSEGNTFNVAKDIALDIIGTIYKPTGNVITTDDGLTYPEQAPIDGFHANIRGSLTDEQQAGLPLVGTPANPYRVWA